MPYPNEHSARLQDPGMKRIRTRRTKGSGNGKVQGVKIPSSISVIWYIIKTRDGGEAPVAQALRFPISSWGKSPTKAKSWLKNHKIKYKSFEAAAPEKQSLADDGQYSCECIECGYKESYDDHCSDHECPKCGGQMRRADRPGPGQPKQSRQSTEKIPAAALRFREEDAGVTVLAAKEDEPDKPRFQMIANSGKVIQNHPYWGNFAVDMKGIKIGNKRKPALRDHDTGKIVGWTENIVADEKAGIVAQGYFSQTTEHGREAQGLADEKFPWQASIYIPPTKIERVEEGEEVEVNGYALKGPGTVFRKSILREVSFCALGADERTSAVAMSDGEAIELDVEVLGYESVSEETEMDELTIEKLREEHADLCEQIENEAVDKLKVDDKVEEALKSERERISGILNVAKEFEQFEIAVKAIEDGETVEQAELKLKGQQIEKLKAAATQAPGPNDAPKDNPLEGLEGDELFEAEWQKDAKLRDEFMSKEDYLAFRRAEGRGVVKILKK